MLKKTSEWWRLVKPKPDDESIQKSKLACSDLVRRLLEAKDAELFVACVSGAANGFESGFCQDSPAVQIVSECISSHHPAFITDLSESALEYRACCAIALGEILAGEEVKEKADKGSREVIASSLISALGMRSKPKERYLQVMLEELRSIAFEALERAATARRQRKETKLRNLDKLEVAGDLPAFWQNFWPNLKTCIKSLEQNAAMDREELEVLWWLYNGFSETIERPLIELAPGTAALCCGVEMANRVMAPPLDSVRQMAFQTAGKGRVGSELSARPLAQIVEDWEERIWDLLAPTESRVKGTIRNFPAPFPLSWLCMRLIDSQGASGWDQEFRLTTGLDPTHRYQPGNIAVQAFDEQIAQAILYYRKYT